MVTLTGILMCLHICITSHDCFLHILSNSSFTRVLMSS